jgi:hypothetical protein
MGAPAGAPWTTPTSRPRPATIHEGFSYCVPEDYGTLPSWDTASQLSLQQTPSEGVISRPISVHQDFFPGTPIDHADSWASKPCEETYEFPELPTDLGIGQAYTSDEAIPILELKYPGHHRHDDVHFDGQVNPRRLSASSFTTGAMSDMTSYEDFSTTMSEAPSFTSDYPPPSNRNSFISSTQLSPVASPRMTPHGRSDLVRTASRGRASPSPRPGMRSAPYSVEAAKSKRWSTGSYATTPNRRASPFVYSPHDAFAMHSRELLAGKHHAVYLATNMMSPAQQQPQHNPFFLPSGPPPPFPRHSMLLPSQLPSHLPSQTFPDVPHPFDHPHPHPAPLLSHGLFRMLQSNADPHSLHGHYADLSDPPDLYASLHEEQIPPPPEDMNPSDPDLVPHEQELRFEGDLYTPRWVRGHGNKREGWCGICKPGRWLVLKNSAFWYDKSFTHGISAATGQPFQEPQETRRMDGNPDVWEGLCGSCNDWIALVSSKKKGTTWFRHAYKCHTHPKVKDAPKRRRENSHSRALAASQMPRPKLADQPAMPQTPLTPPPLAPAPISSTSTPTPARMAMHHHHQQLPPHHHMPAIPRSHPPHTHMVGPVDGLPGGMI